MLLSEILLTCTVLGTYSIPRIEARLCTRNIYGTVSQTHYERTSSSYSTSCGLFGWSRCRRTRYRLESSQVYQRQIVRMQTQCCDGYTMSGSTCIPICDASCVSPRYCREPNDCQCIDSRYSGPSCDTPVCSNCPSPRVCLAPETCQCRPGYTGTNCNEDIDECGVLATDPVCEQLCMNTRGSYSCACYKDFAMGDDGIRCIGTVNASLATVNSSVLLAEWSHPEWDRENLIVAYNITCSNDMVDSSVLLNDTAPGQNVQLSLNLNTEGEYECCVIVITSNGNGLPSCINGSTTLTISSEDESPRGNQSTGTPLPILETDGTPLPILETDEFKIGVGAAGGCLALLIFIAMLLLCCCRFCHKKKTSAQEAYCVNKDDPKGMNNNVYASEELQQSSHDYEVPFQSDHFNSKKNPDMKNDSEDPIYCEPYQGKLGDDIMMSQCYAYKHTSAN